MIRLNYGFAGFLASMILVVGGCARTFPKQVTDQVDTKILFSDVIKDPDAYKGKHVMFAGDIVGVTAEKDGTYLEVLQRPAKRSGEPLRTDESAGRFLAVSKQFLDPAVYSRGRSLTIVGEVIGDSVKSLGEVPYRYPLIEVEAAHLWEPSYGPRVAVGVGVFHRF